MNKITPLVFESGWLRRWQKPVCAWLAFGMLASPVLAQAPALPVPPEFSAEAPEPVPEATPEIAEESAPEAPGETPSTVTAETKSPYAGRTMKLMFDNQPLDGLLEFLEDWLGKIIITSPGLTANITLKSRNENIPAEDGLKAIEAVLAMHNIVLIPMGDKFLRAVPISQARQEGMQINIGIPETGFGESDKLISQVFTMKHMELTEIQPIIQSLLHGYGKIQTLDRANSMMITDTEANLARITELLEFLDQPVEAKIETRIYEIRYAEASQIAGKLNELIADSQAKEEKPQINVPVEANIPTPPGVIRARQAQAAPAQAGGEVEAAMQMAERGVIQGKVRIIADDRTNILFVISRLENFVFFDRIVDVLDRQIDPAITVRVVALEYAKAEEISGILNEFIGAAAAKTVEGAPNAGESDTATGEATDSRSQALRDFIAARTAPPAAPAAGAAGESVPGTQLGRLSSETKILADKRTNSLLMMGKLKDLEALEDLIDHLDIMLAQVVIEAVIVEVSLGDEIQSGVDWVQKSMMGYGKQVIGPGGEISVADPVLAWGGGSEVVDGDVKTRDASTVVDDSALFPGMTWYTSIYDLNIDAVIRLMKSSSNAQILSTPVIVTTDNTEAQIIASTQRPVVSTTSTTDGGSQRSSYEYRDIGINLTVTPRINPQRMVVMEVKQSADDVAKDILIDGNPVPEITRRELTATLSVGDRSTIALGGLILSRNSEAETKVPFLGDIPVFGRLFKYKKTEKTRSELVVLLTPYVLMTPAEARAESTRLYSANSSRQRNWHTGWSDSPLGNMTDREKAQYVKEWDENRPAPFTRDLSIDLGEIDSGNPEPESPRRRSLFGEEGGKEETPPSGADAPEVEKPSAVEPDVSEEKPAEAGKETTSRKSNLDPSQPVPAR